jgi:uncharacterized protein (TIGR02265 family)
VSEVQLVFSQKVEGLLRAVGPLDANAKQKFRAIGFDPDLRLEPAYPVEKYVEMQKVAVDVFAPSAPFDASIETLGRRFVDGYGETIVGKAVLVTMRLLGPKRTLERLSRTLSTGSSFFETKLSEFSPGVWHLWLNRVTFPGWYVGLIRRGLELAGAKDVELKVLQHDGAGLGLTLEVRWR